MSISLARLPVCEPLTTPTVATEPAPTSEPLTSGPEVILVLMIVAIMLLVAAVRLISIVWTLLKPALALIGGVGMCLVMVILAIVMLTSDSAQAPKPTPSVTDPPVVSPSAPAVGPTSPPIQRRVVD